MKQSLRNLPSLAQTIKTHNLMAKKALGQNFLLDPNFTDRIARLSAPVEGKTYLEIGPGPGGLTRALLNNGARKIICVERDERCRPILEQLNDLSDNRLEINFQDALTFDISTIKYTPFTIAANLPYNIATVLLTNWLTIQGPLPYEAMYLMFQKEVAERIVAVPKTKKFGRLSVLSQIRTEPKIVMRVAASHFIPPPKVESAIVEFIPREEALVEVDLDVLQTTTALLFGKRRKMLRQILKSITLYPADILDPLEIEGTLRPEQLTPRQIGMIAQKMDKLKKT